MGLIIGSKSYATCDVAGCNSGHSTPHPDQTEAKRLARREGWHFSQDTGRATCPICLHRQQYTHPERASLANIPWPVSTTCASCKSQNSFKVAVYTKEQNQRGVVCLECTTCGQHCNFPAPKYPLVTHP